MAMITCSCGYAGPEVAEGSRSVCPICRSPVEARHRSQAATDAGSITPGNVFGQLAADDSESESLGMRGTFRIPCPNGHVNITPAHMLGTQVVCPKCNAFYVLQMSDSLEHRRVAEERARKKAEEEARKWLRRAIYAAVFIGLSLAGMIVLSLAYR